MPRKVFSRDQARELAERAWVERASREKGDLDLTKFERRAAKQAFSRWWNKEVE